MAEIPTKNQIKVGSNVLIETKQDQGTGRLLSGVIAEILTSSESHPHGIKVKLEEGQIGRVKKINESKKASKLEMFEDLDKKQIPKTEDHDNEFKEYYQYDKKMDAMEDAKENTGARKGMTRSAQKRIATAVCAFGNSHTGGFVYVGIRADGIVSGLEKDLKLGEFADYSDSFANHIRSRLGEFLDDRVFITTKLNIKFREIDGKTICIIQIRPADRPLYLHADNEEVFFVRGPTAMAEKLRSRDQFQYIKERFPKYG